MKVKEFFQTSQERFSYYRDLLGVDKYIRIANFIYEMEELMINILSSSLHIDMKDSLIKDLIEMTHYRVRKIEKDEGKNEGYDDEDEGDDLVDDCCEHGYECWGGDPAPFCLNCGYVAGTFYREGKLVERCEYNPDEACPFCGWDDWNELTETMAEEDSMYDDDDDLDLEDDFEDDDLDLEEDDDNEPYCDCDDEIYEEPETVHCCPNCGYVVSSFCRDEIKLCNHDIDEVCLFCWRERLAEDDSICDDDVCPYCDDDELDLEDDFSEDEVNA